MFAPPVMLMRMPVAPSICTSSSSGLSTAIFAAVSARASPSAVPVPISATPMLLMMVRTSAKSTLIRPGMVIRSEMPCTALSSTSSAFLKVSSSVVRSSATASSRWLGMVMSVSTAFFSSLMPCSACLRRRLPSKTKGLVTTPTVSAPTCRARSAITGAPPVPVPPPMPAVTKTMSAPSSASRILSRSSSAACRPISGLAPAPSPLVTCAPSWILVRARLCWRAWQSVLAAMKSTPVSPAMIIVLSALPPPPPTPTTLILAPRSFMSSMTPPNLEELFYPAQKPVPDRRTVTRTEVRAAVLALPCAVEQKAHRRCVLRALHHVRETADAAGQPAPDRKPQHLFRQLGHAVQVGGASCQHGAGGEQVLLPGLLDLALHQLEQLLHPRFDDLAEDAPVEHPRRAPAYAGHLDGVVLVQAGALRAAELHLELLRLLHGRAQPHRDVVGEVVAAQRDDAGVLDGAAGENGQIGGAAPDVHQRHAQLLLFVGQHRLGGGERFEHDVRHREAGLAAALDDVLRAGDGGGDDVHLRLQPHAAHAQRLADAV